MCKAHSKVTDIKQQKYFITSSALNIIQSSYYIHGPLGDEIFLLFYMCHFAMGLTHCYKTTVFYSYICSFFTKFTLHV